jgi:hypothetical protein
MQPHTYTHVILETNNKENKCKENVTACWPCFDAD